MCTFECNNSVTIEDQGFIDYVHCFLSLQMQLIKSAAHLTTEIYDALWVFRAD